jgi:hypothetical protein
LTLFVPGQRRSTVREKYSQYVGATDDGDINAAPQNENIRYVYDALAMSPFRFCLFNLNPRIVSEAALPSFRVRRAHVLGSTSKFKQFCIVHFAKSLCQFGEIDRRKRRLDG